MRINKYLARCGKGSRRGVESLILEGKVSVNGKIVTALSQEVQEGDAVKLQGKICLLPRQSTHIIFNKPPGFLCSKSDPQERLLIYDKLPKEFVRLHYVGRLDYASRGLLLLTDDGELSQNLCLPKNQVPKTYWVQLSKKLSDEDQAKLRKGMRLSDGLKTKPAKVKVRGPWAEITLTEGKNREIRRMMQDLGYGVQDLQRVSFGNLALGSLKEGKHRKLTEQEVAGLQELF
jgi:23S rRNA pseudouridine2605 synthase